MFNDSNFVILGEAAGVAENISNKYNSYWVSCSDKSDIQICGMKRIEGGRWISRFLKAVIMLKRLSGNDLILIQNTFRPFSAKLDIINSLFLLSLARLWKGRVLYLVVGGSPIVYTYSKSPSVSLRDFYVQAKKEGYYGLWEGWLLYFENRLVDECDKVYIPSSFYQKAFSKYKYKQITYKFPLSVDFFQGFPVASSLSEWYENLVAKLNRSCKVVKIAYIYRTNRKGSSEIIKALEGYKSKRTTFSIKIYNNISFNELLKVVNDSHIVIDATSGPLFGYLSLLAYFSSCVVLCGCLEDGRYGHGGMSICCEERSESDCIKLIKSQLLRAIIFLQKIDNGERGLVTRDEAEKYQDLYNGHFSQ
jgi:hypothetical protein